jgi:hypothetical protein
MLLEVRIVRKPVAWGVKYVPPEGTTGTPGVGRDCVGAGVGNRVAVFVAVNSSAPMDVTVGVKVSGVLVEVAKRFWVGRGVWLGGGVGVTMTGGGVGLAPSCGSLISGRPEQPARNTPRRKI